MKKILMLCISAAAMASCNDKGQSAASNTTDSSASVSSSAKAVDLPYSKSKPMDWEWGSNENLLAAMNALKGYQNLNPEECAKYFGDSVKIEFDHLDKVIPHDSLAGFFKAGWAKTKHVDIRMDDYESVISKDKSVEYVSLWYKQIEENINGKKDSLDVMNDCKMKNGKIILLSEKIRHYGETNK